MKYDFTTRVNRSGDGSAKWDDMFQKKPDVSSGVVPLSVADMELLNPPDIIQGLKSHLDKTVLGYSLPVPQYYHSVIKWMKKRHNWEVKKEEILLAPGIVPAFYMAIKALTKPGEGVIIQPPVYYPFFKAINNNNRKLVTNPLIRDEENLSYRIDFDDLEAKAKDPNNKILLFCSPHNPVGRVWTEEELRKVSEICLANNVLMLSDEIHFDILLPGIKHTVYSTLSKEAEQNCIVFTAPSKTFNLAGMQTSNLVIPNREIYEQVQNEFISNSIFMLGNLGLKACEIAYARCGEWLDEFIVLLRMNCDFVREYFDKHIPQVKVYHLEGTYLQWLDFRAFGLGAKALENFMINDAEWFTDEGIMFGEEGSGFERINLACPTAVLEEALERLRKALTARKFI
ncbi:MAG: pyridoxal phosphate-dependent aminotransferase [Treponema sp.]|nr:pyridoxal phosphate-dependent aminotransferase [Treponema sp.]